jgi:hypothetical protein
MITSRRPKHLFLIVGAAVAVGIAAPIASAEDYSSPSPHHRDRHQPQPPQRQDRRDQGHGQLRQEYPAEVIADQHGVATA